MAQRYAGLRCVSRRKIEWLLNKEITELLTKKNIPNYIALANLLYETKTEMSLQH